MKGNIKVIVKKLTPQTSIEEIILCCDSVSDFNELFEEYYEGRCDEFEKSGEVSCLYS